MGLSLGLWLWSLGAVRFAISSLANHGICLRFAKSRQAISPSSVKAYSFKNACICELGPVKQSISFFSHTHRHTKTVCSAASFAVRGLGRAAAALRTSFLPERPEDTVSRSDVDDIIRTTLSCRSSVPSQGPALGN